MGAKKKTMVRTEMPSVELLIKAWDDEIAEDQAIERRIDARLTGEPTEYEVKLAAALNHMVDWARAGKFKPHNEEDVQCFLYHSLVLQFGDATHVRTKFTHGSSGVVADGEKIGGMYFPDLIIGESNSDPDAIYIELKVRASARKAFHQLCLADVKKLAKNHHQHRQFFILYDCDPKVVYLSAAQRKELQDSSAEGCTVWHYPYELNESVGKASAAKAIATMVAQGVDFQELGKSNAKKAEKTKLTKAKALLAAASQAGLEAAADDGLSKHLAACEGHLHAVIRSRVGDLVEKLKLKLPRLAAPLPTQAEPKWFPVPGMYGGLSYWADYRNDRPTIVCSSWSRIEAGSGQRHEITEKGFLLVEEGFV